MRVVAVGFWVLAQLGCSKRSEDPAVLLAKINTAQEDYALADFYAASRKFLTEFPDHDLVEEVRYSLAAQLVAENLLTPDTKEADEARRLLAKSKTFEAALMLMKFDKGDPKRRAERVLQRFGGPEFQGHRAQVYVWIIDELLKRKALKPAAEYARLFAQNAPKTASKYAGLIRRAETLGKPIPWSIEAGGKVQLLDFWASWCAPCLDALPELFALNARYKAQGLEIIGVNMDEDRQAMERAVKRYAIPWRQLHSPKLADNLGVELIPAYMLTDRKGRLALTELNLKDLDAAIQGLIVRPVHQKHRSQAD